MTALVHPNTVLRAVALQCGLTVAELRGRDLSMRTVIPRQLAMTLLFDLLELGSEDIGVLLLRDHATVLSGIQRMRGRMQSDPVWLQRYRTIICALEAFTGNRLAYRARAERLVS